MRSTAVIMAETPIIGPGAVTGAEQRPAKSLDDADHRVEAVERSPGSSSRLLGYAIGVANIQNCVMNGTT